MGRERGREGDDACLPACLPVPETERLVVVDGRDATRGANGVAQAVYVGGARGRGGVGAKPSKARGGIGGTKRRPGELGVRESCDHRVRRRWRASAPPPVTAKHVQAAVTTVRAGSEELPAGFLFLPPFFLLFARKKQNW